jgi:hypothetical protein
MSGVCNEILLEKIVILGDGGVGVYSAMGGDLGSSTVSPWPSRA